MKVLLIFAVVVATSYARFTQETLTKEYSDNVKAQLLKCKTQYPSISEENFQKLANNRKMPSTTDEECFALCYAKSRGYYKGPGQLDLNKLKAGNQQKYKDPTNLAGANAIDETCVSRVKSETNDCKTASNFFVCRAQQAKSQGFKFAKYSQST